jgi:hypothetical protein
LSYLAICNGVVGVHATIALAPDVHVGGGRGEPATSPGRRYEQSPWTERRETFEEEVTLNVAPRTRCRVIFSWKEIRQKGVVQLASGGFQARIPYEVVAGITFDQQQIDDQA